MKTLLRILWVTAALASNAFAAKPVALVYDGPGSCEDGCSEAAAEVAKQAGFTPKFVGPDALPEDATPAQVKALFGNAKVWIQPGGKSGALSYMTDKLIDELTAFIKNGGGYVGFCAGAFIATNPIGGTRGEGLGIFPGRTNLYKAWPIPGYTYSLETVNWMGKTRQIYFEGGAFLYGFEGDPNAETIATFEDGFIAAARTKFGKGRVFITGLHPEAPAKWTEEDGIKDPDGPEIDLAVGMVRWVTNTETSQERKISRNFIRQKNKMKTVAARAEAIQ